MSERIEHIFAHFDRTADQFFSKEEFRARLSSGKKLRIKYGVDVTAPTLHIGHAVNLWLMRYLQGLGHKVVFLIGDFTTRIGDPDGRLEMRPVIPQEDIEKNAEEFIRQAKMVLRFDSPELLEIRRNSEWFGKMSTQEFMNLLSMVTQARLISRDMFQMRIAQGKEIYMHEMIYPVLQGYDSVAVESDLAIIGSDQLFNEMMGRFFQERLGQKPQTVVTTKITPGTDGRLKQSKSIGNYIGLGHSPRDKFGRVMSIPDTLTEEYFRVYTDMPLEEIDRMKADFKKRPREAKVKLAYAIVGRYHGHEIAVWEKEWFEHTVSRGEVPEDIPTLHVITPRMTVLELVSLARAGKSKSDTRRLITQGGVELNREKRTDPAEELVLKTNDILKVGKRNWWRIEIAVLNDLETEKLWMKPLQLKDVDALQKHIESWGAAKYLAKALPPPPPKKGEVLPAREVFRRIIAQPEPRNQWLWKIEEKAEPDKIVGIAHLRATPGGGADEKIWLDPDLRNEWLLQEAMMAVNEHGFNVLGLSDIMIQEIFAQVSAPREMEVLQQRFMGMDRGAFNKEIPDGGLGLTRDGWDKMKEWWHRNRPDKVPKSRAPKPKLPPLEKPKPELEEPKKPAPVKKPPAPKKPEPSGGGKK